MSNDARAIVTLITCITIWFLIAVVAWQVADRAGSRGDFIAECKAKGGYSYYDDHGNTACILK